MNHFRTWVLLVVTVAAFSGCQDVADPIARPPGGEAAPPLEVKFSQSCGLPQGRQRVYDATTGVFHVHFESVKPIGARGSGLYERSAFEVTKSNGPFVKPSIFRLTGIPPDYGCVGDPLSLCVGCSDGLRDNLRLDGKCYALVDDPLAQGPVDKTLFRVERQGDVVTVEFTEQGRELLKPGVLISFKVDTGW
jgi:hypothetical protein